MANDMQNTGNFYKMMGARRAFFRKLTATALLTVVLANGVYAAQCNSTAVVSGVTETTPDNRFIVSEDGSVVTDKLSGLMWARCSMGYTITPVGKTPVVACEVDQATQPSFTWQQALTKAAEIRNTPVVYLKYSNWRVPTFKELNSIIERRCSAPSVNWDLFPNTKSGFYWSSTPFRLGDSATTTDVARALAVDFDGAGMRSGGLLITAGAAATESDVVYLRLVRCVNATDCPGVPSP
ncbi:MAG: DUF1566 domain-containing protein [Pseudomonadota bacterium]